jgi:hypothetical protein
MIEDKIDLLLEASKIDDRIRNRYKFKNLPLSNLIEFFSLLDTEEEKEEFLSSINQESSDELRKMIDGGLL